VIAARVDRQQLRGTNHDAQYARSTAVPAALTVQPSLGHMTRRQTAMKHATSVGGVPVRVGCGTKGAMPIEFVAHVAGVDDEYCLVAAVAERDDMHVIIAQDALAALGLEDAEIRVHLAVEAQSVEVLREYLRRILTYGRPEAQPAVLRL
jgi:hypothetical protein